MVIIASSDIRIRTSLPSQMFHLSAVCLGIKNAVLLCLFPTQVVRAINITSSGSVISRNHRTLSELEGCLELIWSGHLILQDKEIEADRGDELTIITQIICTRVRTWRIIFEFILSVSIWVSHLVYISFLRLKLIFFTGKQTNKQKNQTLNAILCNFLTFFSFQGPLKYYFTWSLQ